MIFKSIRIKEGMFQRIFCFSDGVNLIHSGNNSCGKTTLLRFMLYSLGYKIPSTKKIRFGQCEVETIIEYGNNLEMKLQRHSDDYVVATVDGVKQTFVLPMQIDDLHSQIFGTENRDILQNLLGAYYLDQEKGWTLLNRGIVIGSIHFNIEELIRGLSGRDCSELIQEEARVSRELSKYRQMFSVAQYRETIDIESGSIASDSYEEKVNAETAQLLIQQKAVQGELRRVDQTLSDNRKFKQFIEKIKLLVRAPDDSVFPVTKDNIVGLDDAIELLVAKRKMEALKLQAIESKLNQVQKESQRESEQLAFYKSESLIETFDKRIAAMPLNPQTVKREIERLEATRKLIRNEVERRTKTNNSVITAMYRDVEKYARELGLFDRGSPMTQAYLFTSNLKELSGAILHKTVFAFRLAYLNAIKNALGLQLPIILDSPSGKEVDQNNIQLMVDILNRDFSDHQIIIASIFDYDFPNMSRIEIQGRLIPQE